MFHYFETKYKVFMIWGMLTLKVCMCGNINYHPEISKGLDSLLNFNLFSNSERGGRTFGLNQESLNLIQTNNLDLLNLIHEELADIGRLQNIYLAYKNKFWENDTSNTKVNLNSLQKFKKALLEIAEHNVKAREGKFKFEKSVNIFTDETYGIPTGPIFSNNSRAGRVINNYRLPSPWIPHSYNIASKSTSQSFDWRWHGAVSPVKNQGKCGSCVIFACVAALESHQFLVNQLRHSSPLLDLSEQEVLDCSKNQRGCNNNRAFDILEYMKTSGLPKEWDYPYRDNVGKYCESKYYYRSASVQEYYRVLPAFDEDKLMEVLRNYGPLVVGLFMSDDLKQYSHGIYDNVAGCKDKNGISHNVFMNHMALLVGYGWDEGAWDFKTGQRKQGSGYWVLKNSYGDQWGEGGYFRIERGKRLCLMGEEAWFLYSSKPGQF